MNDFWDEVLKDKIANKPINAAWEDLSKEASFRPIIYIGAGGFGCSIIRKLKEDIDKLIPDSSIKDGFAFIGLDTHPREQNDILTNTEYVSLSVGILPNAVCRDPEYSPYLGWFRELAGVWNAGSLRAGNKVRSVGRIGFLFPASLTEFFNNLNSAYNRVYGKWKDISDTVLPKVYVITSLAGGTGSGLFIDLLAITKSYLAGQAGQKCILQAILATPEALEGEAPASDYPDFYANTYSSLKEIFHFYRGKEELMSYGIEGVGLKNVKVGQQHMPDHIFLITDRNVNGKPVVHTMEELAAMVKSYLLSEIQTPLKTKGGAPKVQDGENRRFYTPGHSNMPRIFGSIGVVRFGLPYDEMTDLYSHSIMVRAISDELSNSNNVSDIDRWIISQGLAEVDTDQLQESLRKDREGHMIRVPLDVEGDLSDIKRAEYGKACKSIKDNKLRAIKETIRPIIETNASTHIEKDKLNLQSTFDEKIKVNSTGEALYFVRSLNALLNKQRDALTNELNENRKKLSKAEEKVNQGVANVSAAAASGFWGRKSRVQCSVTSFGGDLEALLNQQVVVWSQEEGIKLYADLITHCDQLINDWKVVEDAFLSRLKNIRDIIFELIKKIDSMAEINKRSAGNRFSIINSTNIKNLYDEYFSKEIVSAMALRARNNWRGKALINDARTKDKEWLSKAKSAITEEVQDKIKGLDILSIIERFYMEEKEKDMLMTAVMALGSPLFPLDEGKLEPLYMTDRVVAVHPSIRDQFKDFLVRYKKADEGISEAYFSSPHEVIIYTITYGYTGHSLTRINHYKAQYDYLCKKCMELSAKKIPARPVHAWAGADAWDDLMPKPPGEEESYKMFIVGRALNHLYPDAKKQSFIYNKGSYYYLLTEKGKPEKLGNSLEVAIENFSDNPLWREKIEHDVATKIEATGTAEVRKRLETEYMPMIDAEIENCEKGRETTRLRMLRELRAFLNEYVETDLKERKV